MFWDVDDGKPPVAGEDEQAREAALLNACNKPIKKKKRSFITAMKEVFHRRVRVAARNKQRRKFQLPVS
jgi:hypothetical protein